VKKLHVFQIERGIEQRHKAVGKVKLKFQTQPQ